MATGRHVRMVLLGERTAAAFPEEIWQTGISVVQSGDGGDFPGAIYAPLPNFDAQVIGEATSETPWAVEWAWEGTGETFDRGMQIALANAALGLWNAVKGKAGTDSRMVGVRISAFDASGKVIGGANNFTLASASVGSGTTGLPPQVAIVASLRTGRRGPGGRGRMFLPLVASTPAAGGTVGTADRTLVAQSVSDFCDALWDAGVVPAVVNSGALRYSSISHIECGNLYDTQRRRRNQAVETRTTVAPAY